MGNVTEGDSGFTIPDWARPILSRVIASGVAAAVAYGLRKGIDLGLSPDEQRHIGEGVMSVVLGLSLAAYSAAHRLLSVRVNPLDAASPAMSSTAATPLGYGDRTRLADRMKVAAAKPDPLEFPPVEQPRNAVIAAVAAQARDINDNARRAGWAGRPPDVRPDVSGNAGKVYEIEVAAAPAEPPKPKKPRAPRKKKEPSDVVTLRRSTDTTEDAGLGFAPPKDNPHSERGEDD